MYVQCKLLRQNNKRNNNALSNNKKANCKHVNTNKIGSKQHRTHNFSFHLHNARTKMSLFLSRMWNS